MVICFIQADPFSKVVMQPCQVKTHSFVKCSLFDKLLEKLMVTRQCRFLQMHNILYDYQFGFRKYHSTTLAVIDVVEDIIYHHLDNNEIGIEPVT